MELERETLCGSFHEEKKLYIGGKIKVLLVILKAEIFIGEQ